MGPPENPTRRCENQARAGRTRPAHRPRSRRCLLKGCERPFHPEQARQRYCSPECRHAAREWSCWKAQQSYRATAAGKARRNGQSRRYRERVRSRRQPAPGQAVPTARVITTDFFRPLLRPAGLLPGLRASAPIAAQTILFARLPAGHGTCVGTGTPVAQDPAASAAHASRRPAQMIPTY